MLKPAEAGGVDFGPCGVDSLSAGANDLNATPHMKYRLNVVSEYFLACLSVSVASRTVPNLPKGLTAVKN